MWAGPQLAYFEGRGYTIRDAINYWYNNINGSERDGGMVFRDQCYGPRCNDGCPEQLVLQEQGAKDWSAGVRIMIAVLVVAIAVICLLLKVMTFIGSRNKFISIYIYKYPCIFFYSSLFLSHHL